jgi:hypothetical protein
MKNKTELKEQTLYVYVGQGLGLPGLPAELTIQEARELQVADILVEAIKAGVYQAKE